MGDRAVTTTFWRRWAPRVLPIVFLGPVVIMGLTCASFWWSVGKLRESRPAYELTLRALADDARVAAALGSPLTFDEVILGDARVEDGQGEATMTFGVAGPDGHGRAESHALMRDGTWSLRRVTVTVYEDGEPGEVIEVVGE